MLYYGPLLRVVGQYPSFYIRFFDWYLQIRDEKHMSQDGQGGKKKKQVDTIL